MLISHKDWVEVAEELGTFDLEDDSLVRVKPNSDGAYEPGFWTDAEVACKRIIELESKLDRTLDVLEQSTNNFTELAAYTAELQRKRRSRLRVLVMLAVLSILCAAPWVALHKLELLNDWQMIVLCMLTGGVVGALLTEWVAKAIGSISA